MTTTRLGSAGTLLGGRYRLLEPLPGAGRSWRARDEIDDRPLLARAIELPGGLPDAERQQARQRALREAAAVARVQHPGVAPVVDAVVEDGAPWVISVLPPGRSLGEIVADEGPVSPVAAALIGLQVLDALAAAGVPHGELTPYDVVIAENGRVRVTGFATTPLGAVGTRGFGAPEGGPGPAADLWALGVTLHVAVEGRMPGGARPRAGALGPALDALLARDPEDRSDPGRIRPLLVEAAGEPQDPPPPPDHDVHDPEVAAALAAFDAAIASRPVSARRAPQADGTTPVRTSQTVAGEPTTAPDPTPQAGVAAPDRTMPTDGHAATEPASARRTEAADTDAAVPAPATRTVAANGAGSDAPEQPIDAADAPAPPAEAADGADTAPTPDQPTDTATTTAPAPPNHAVDGAETGARDQAANVAAPAATASAADATDRAETAPAPDQATDTAAPAIPAPPTEAVDTDAPDQPTKAATTTAAAGPAEAADGAGSDAADAPAAPTEGVGGAGTDAPEQAAAPASRTEAVAGAGAGAGSDVAPDRTPPAAATPRTGALPGGATAATAPTGPHQPPQPAPEPRTAAPAGRRRLVGAGIVAAVLAAVLIPVLLNRGDDNRGDQPPAARPAAAATPQPTGATASPDTPIPPPAGWQLYRDPAGWSIALPVGWTATRRGTAVTFTQADCTLRVTERTNPPPDTYVAAQNLQPVIEAATPGFDFVRLANVTYRAWPTTDLEFRAGTATRTHSLIRSTVPKPRQVFDFTWTCLDRTWTEDRATFDTALQTFDPGA